MIEQQIRPWDVLDSSVLQLLEQVHREQFVPEPYRALAFMDTEIPLPHGEHMLAPKVEARILEAANLKENETVLEIGTGSGYMAALLAHRARHVTTVEIDPEIKSLADKNLVHGGYANVTVALGDGAHGWVGEKYHTAPYDVIVISGSLPTLPEAFLQQVKIGGRIIATLGQAPVMTTQVITRVSDLNFETVKVFETNMKPLRNASTPSSFKF